VGIIHSATFLIECRLCVGGCTCPHTETQDVWYTIDLYYSHMKAFKRIMSHS